MMSCLQLMAVTTALLFRLSFGISVKTNFCSCESQRHIITVLSEETSQHFCVLRIEGFSRDVEMLKAAQDCCCKATFEPEKLEENKYHTRIPSDGCELVSCGKLL